MTGHIKTWCKNADLLVCGLVRSLFYLLSDPIVFLWEWLIAPSLFLALWFARLWTPHILSTQSGRTSSRATCTTTLTWSWQRRAFTGKANSCFMYLGDCVSNGFCSKTRHLFNYRLRNYCMIQFSYFVYFLFRHRHWVRHQSCNWIFHFHRRGCKWERVAINLEWLISIIFLRYLCCFSSTSFLITAAFIILLLILSNWDSRPTFITFPNRAMLLQQVSAY